MRHTLVIKVPYSPDTMFDSVTDMDDVDTINSETKFKEAYTLALCKLLGTTDLYAVFTIGSGPIASGDFRVDDGIAISARELFKQLLESQEWIVRNEDKTNPLLIQWWTIEKHRDTDYMPDKIAEAFLAGVRYADACRNVRKEE
jgi:hypothetical protein